MDTYYLLAKWDYEYDKEGTWFDDDRGENTYALIEGASYPLPHINKKSLEISSVTFADGQVTAEVHVDHHTITVSSGQEPVITHASNSYSVSGDCVHESLCLKLTVEKQ